MFPTEQSEYEPLIDSSSTSTATSSKRSYSFKTGLFFISLLIATSILIYVIFPRNGSSQNVHSPSSINWVRMEQAHTHSAKIPKSWDEKEECHEDHPFVLTLALKQQNTEGTTLHFLYYAFLNFTQNRNNSALHKHVAEVSHPSNTDTFHKYWTADKVRSYFKPSSQALSAVTDWLKENGFSSENKKLEMVTIFGNVLRIHLTCGDANRLLNTRYMFYENNKNGKTHLRVKVFMHYFQLKVFFFFYFSHHVTIYLLFCVFYI